MTPQMTPIQSLAGTPTPAGHGMSSTVGSNGMMGSVQPRTTMSPLEGLTTMIWIWEAFLLSLIFCIRKYYRTPWLFFLCCQSEFWIPFTAVVLFCFLENRTRWSWLINETYGMASEGKEYPERGGIYIHTHIVCKEIGGGVQGAPGIAPLTISLVGLDLGRKWERDTAAGDDLWIATSSRGRENSPPHPSMLIVWMRSSWRSTWDGVKPRHIMMLNMAVGSDRRKDLTE